MPGLVPSRVASETALQTFFLVKPSAGAPSIGYSFDQEKRSGQGTCSETAP